MLLFNGEALLVALIVCLIPLNCSALQCYVDKRLEDCSGRCLKITGESPNFPNNEAKGCLSYHRDYQIANKCSWFKSGQGSSEGVPADLIEFLDYKLGFRKGTLCLCNTDACNTGTILGKSSISLIIVTFGLLCSVYYSS